MLGGIRPAARCVSRRSAWRTSAISFMSGRYPRASVHTRLHIAGRPGVFQALLFSLVEIGHSGRRPGRWPSPLRDWPAVGSPGSATCAGGAAPSSGSGQRRGARVGAGNRALRILRRVFARMDDPLRPEGTRSLMLSRSLEHDVLALRVDDARDGRGKRSGGADRRLGPRLVRRRQVLIVLGAGASVGVSQAVGRMGVVKRFGDHRVGDQGRTAPAASAATAAITAGEMRRPGGWLIMSSCLGFVWSSLRRPRPGAGGSGWMGRSSGWRTRCGTWWSFCVGWGWKWSRPR